MPEHPSGMTYSAATNHVILPPFLSKTRIGLREIDYSIRSAAKAYLATVTADRIKELLLNADSSILSGSASTVYKKRTGHYKLTQADIVNLFVKLGTNQDRETLQYFDQARIDFQSRLEDTELFRFIFKQAGLGRWTYYARSQRPDLWTADEMLRVLDIIEKHQA